jgi:hypothetical protein
VLRKEIINTNPKQIHKSRVHKGAAQEVERVVVVVVEEEEEGEVREARKAKEMINFTAVAEIEMGLGQLPD